MRNLFALVFVFAFAMFAANTVVAQEDTATTDTTQVSDSAAVDTATTAVTAAPEEAASDSEAAGDQVLKRYFIEGDWKFMSLVLICLIMGLAFALERVITLNIATVNTDKLLKRIDQKLKEKDVEGAKNVCKSTQGPTSSILLEGLKRHDEGIEAVEKAVVSYGAVQMGLLEKGMIWVGLFIALAPMLGFLGTVVGMIQAFDKIASVGDISPTIVASGIKVALLTTVFGLVVAIILQVFYNYLISKIDSIVNKMEDASIALVDSMIDNGILTK